ncbi:divergent polysaccharide deacetylase family protein [Tistrella bauzanensis]|uniref:Divergent polysaccharide deacetylase family protein n=1 Tax=Tistrella arctica TaxID=3133430 RepID=A0ABU9YJP0_9PROT
MAALRIRRTDDPPRGAAPAGSGSRTIWTITGLLALAGLAAAALIALAASLGDAPDTAADDMAQAQVVMPMPVFQDAEPRAATITESADEARARAALEEARAAAQAAPPAPAAPPPPTGPDTPVVMSANPAPGLSQESDQGPLPVVASDGRAPWQVYARPFDRGDARPRLALVVGGLGFSEATTQAAIDLPGAVTLAFSPYAPELKRWIERARKAGHEVMLELPMEPDGYPRNDAGPAALLTTLEPDRNRERLHWTLSRATGYVGVKPLMGDRFLRSPQHLRPVLDEMQERGIMIVAQENEATDIGVALAREIGVPRALARFTVDAVATPQAIDQRLNALEALARRDGKALAVAEAWPVSLERIANWIATIEARGFAFAPATALADAPGLAPDGGAVPPPPGQTAPTQTPAPQTPAGPPPASDSTAAGHSPGNQH